MFWVLLDCWSPRVAAMPLAVQCSYLGGAALSLMVLSVGAALGCGLSAAIALPNRCFAMGKTMFSCS